jgi:hypothetical protein
MKRLMVVLAVLALFMVCASGCISKEIKDEVHLNFVRAKRYGELMDAGRTTADQDKRFIKKLTKIAAALDWKINEDKDAKAWYDAEEAKKTDPPEGGGGDG